MQQNELYPAPGSRKNRKRVGRGNGSGHGTFCGRGIKGQKSRSGVQIQRGFEGGQLPIIKRLPRKRGFYNPFRVEYSPVNLGALSSFAAGAEITPQMLFEAGLIDTLSRPVKVLADGEITNAITVKANKFSEAAKAKIEAAGGKVEEI
jgi:large subunit ribosomal protein L15